MSKRIVATVIVLLLALGAAWYFLSPGYAMSQLRDAAVAGDAQELEARIDFPRVREALKVDMRASMGTHTGDSLLSGPLAMKMLDGLIDAVITPEAMATVVSEGRLGKRDPAAKRDTTEWDIHRESFGRFRAAPVTPDGDNAPSMIFERDGLGWKVVEIDIPDNEMAPGL
jgi:hypothetical protein